MNTRVKIALGGALTGLALLALNAGPIAAQQAPTQVPAAPTHEQMDQMADAMHGQGTSQRMHETMGADGEKLMDQCVAMMGMMQNMQGMGGQDGQSMPSMPGR